MKKSCIWVCGKTVSLLLQRLPTLVFLPCSFHLPLSLLILCNLLLYAGWYPLKLCFLLLSSSELSRTGIPPLRNLSNSSLAHRTTLACANPSRKLYCQVVRAFLCIFHLIPLLLLTLFAPYKVSPTPELPQCLVSLVLQLLYLSVSPWRSFIKVWILFWFPSRLPKDSYSLAWFATAKSTKASVQPKESHRRCLFWLPDCT